MKEKLIGILHRLFKIYSPHGGEGQISNYTANFLRYCGFTIEKDTHNNLWASRGANGQLPLLHAHFYTLQDEKDMEHLPEMTYDRAKGEFHMDGVHIGCDDKAGIAIILYLAMYSNLEFKALFTLHEGMGTRISEVDRNFLSNVCWALSLDTGGGNTIITKYKNRETCSLGFVDELMRIAKAEGVLLQEGQSRLAPAEYYISEHIKNTAAIPVGFYNPHRKGDCLKVSETYKALKIVRRCIEEKGKLIISDHSIMGSVVV